MPKISVELGANTYDITIEKGLRHSLAQQLRQMTKATKVAIITDTRVARLHGAELTDQLTRKGFEVVTIAIEAGEASKNLATLAEVYDRLAKKGLTRQDLIITLGGGVVGDLGGFAAATFLRGIAFVQVPTTLLAQIDSSVGGKVAVNLPTGKNLAGSFYQPKAVFIDPDYLTTLPKKYLHEGMAEVIKTAAIGDSKLFADLESYTTDEELLANIEQVIERCCRFKAKVVAADEHDTGERMLLNFGHTVGHAVEQNFGYGKFNHGKAVAIGMMRITRNTERLHLTAEGTTERLGRLLKQYGLPTKVNLELSKIMTVVTRDKKKRGKELTIVALKTIGKGQLLQIEFNALPRYIK